MVNCVGPFGLVGFVSSMKSTCPIGDGTASGTNGPIGTVGPVGPVGPISLIGPIGPIDPVGSVVVNGLGGTDKFRKSYYPIGPGTMFQGSLSNAKNGPDN